ncbi:ceramide kinase isoform X2 [Malania oleifera]|uniref:ceramide kinase isoform X2 n=1 Tax=Malania oleifera TaxID=397392 RepID=UPI0025AE8946|nr:ceramide kinase isoform X2 [Malania oleifera]
MDRNANVRIIGEKCLPSVQFDGEESIFSSNLFLDHVGEVVLTLNSAGLSWKLAESSDSAPSICLGIKLVPESETQIKFSNVYAIEFINWGLIHESLLQNATNRLLGQESEMYRFTVHGVQKSETQPSLWVLAVYTFGHKDLETCQMWVNRINASLNVESGRPKSLLVFVHPMSGKGNGCRTWEAVAPIFSCAKVKTKVIVTQRAGHAFDVMASIKNREIGSYDGVVAVGGDGFFNEILNGLLSSRHKSCYPPSPADFVHSVRDDDSAMVYHPNETVTEASSQNEDHSPLLPSSGHNGSLSNFGTGNGSCNKDQDPEFPLPNERFRFGIIPAGSTDAIVMCTTGTRDPITSALQIVLGKKVHLDIAQIVSWKKTSTSKDEPCIRYAASFAGSYEAEVQYIEVKSEKTNPTPDKGPLVSTKQALWSRSKKSERVVCRVNCNICDTKPMHASTRSSAITPYSHAGESRWLRSKGRFLSIGAAIISCRNERAPDGLVADAHLSDGFLHLILIRDCPHALYLWHLTQLARKGGNPLNFDFVEHHKTPVFTFTSSGRESVWNLDGEIFQAHKLSAQVFRGLVSLFASGPEV